MVWASCCCSSRSLRYFSIHISFSRATHHAFISHQFSTSLLIGIDHDMDIWYVPS